ncbi:hypothetical protein GGF32_006460 [Allomyces javanicus]|nr:hypothetical protein GGF32_006460 [Allomyces javanicus]
MSEFIEVTDDILVARLGYHRMDRAVSLFKEHLEPSEWRREESRSDKNRRVVKYFVTKEAIRFLELVRNTKLLKQSLATDSDLTVAPSQPDPDVLYVYKSPTKNAHVVCNQRAGDFLYCLPTRWSREIKDALKAKFPTTQAGHFRAPQYQITRLIQLVHAFHETLKQNYVTDKLPMQICAAVLGTVDIPVEPGMQAQDLFKQWYTKYTVHSPMSPNERGIRDDVLLAAFSKWADEHCPWIIGQIDRPFLDSMVQVHRLDFMVPFKEGHLYIQDRVLVE